jgi:5'-3' exonuclease
MRLLVIDGNSIANRAFYGIKLLTTKDGRYTNAIFGFLNILLSLLKECEPDEVAVAFDLKAPTFRHKMYDGYKATRHKMPDELAAQMPVLKELLAALGYREVTAEGWEADDILGTLSAAVNKLEFTVFTHLLNTLFSLVSAVIDNYNHLDLLLKGDELILLIKSVYKKDNNCELYHRRNGCEC